MDCRQIPQREPAQGPPSPAVRALAARVRVNADRRVGKTTPAWIVVLARTEKKPGRLLT